MIVRRFSAGGVVPDQGKVRALCAQLLEAYNESDDATADDIQTVETFKAQRYGLTNIYQFQFRGITYYVSDDYSLYDNAEYFENLIRDIEHDLTGHLLKNLMPQSDGAIYATGIADSEYYLWKCLE